MVHPPLPIIAHRTPQGMHTNTFESQNPLESNNCNINTHHGVQTDTMQPHNSISFIARTTTNRINTPTTGMAYDHYHQEIADHQMADQQMVDRQMADQELADQEMADLGM
jgi:hypothetical protein